jgi:hypothetical protein
VAKKLLNIEANVPQLYLVADLEHEINLTDKI